MDEEGWAATKTALGRPRLFEMRTAMGYLRLIDKGAGDNPKRRFELSRDGRCIQFPQWHSPGGGIRPDILPDVSNLRYIIQGRVSPPQKLS